MPVDPAMKISLDRKITSTKTRYRDQKHCSIIEYQNTRNPENPFLSIKIQVENCSDKSSKSNSLKHSHEPYLRPIKKWDRCVLVNYTQPNEDQHSYKCLLVQLPLGQPLIQSLA